MSAARDAILARIRATLAGLPAQPAPRRAGPPPGAPPPLDDEPARVALFAERARAVGAGVHLPRDLAEARETLAALLRPRAPCRVALSDAPLVAALADALPDGCAVLRPPVARADLLTADVGLTSARLAVAETGSLVLDHAGERNRLTSLLPPMHVALLTRDLVRSTLDDAFAALAAGDGPPHTVTFLTGPSRTADIELQLVVGAHGPKDLQILLLPRHPCDS